MSFIAYVFPKLQTLKNVARQMSERPVSEHPSTVNMLKGPKNL